MRLRPQDNDTICALASASGAAGISVIRLSGPDAIDIARKSCSFLPKNLESHKVYYGKLSHPNTAEVIDEVLVAYFEEGRSFSGEETLEVSTHGNPIVVSEVLRVLVESGARPADRGEFSYRAFMSGRIDLVQAESILDLIQSDSKVAARLSLKQLEGGLSKRIVEVKNLITGILANLEANIDFAAEDIEIESFKNLKVQGEMAQEKIRNLIATHRAGRILKSGFRVVLVGRPNVGKSSLLNSLLEEEKSIVTEIPGTTRDLVDGTLIIDGYKVDITDTAGLRESNDEIEKIGQGRAQKRISQSDLVLFVLDAQAGLVEEDERLMALLPKEKTALIWNKVDLSPGFESTEDPQVWASQLLVSAKEHFNLNEVKNLILERLRVEAPIEESSVSLNARHFEHLVSAEKLLGDSLTLMVKEQSPDLIALDLHGSLKEIYSVLGEVYDDQVMDAVFNQFCIGK